jgi:hypothetical protein
MLLLEIAGSHGKYYVRTSVDLFGGRRFLFLFTRKVREQSESLYILVRHTKGAGANVARGKRVEIVKVTVIGPDGTAIEVEGKACTKCGEVKALTEFSVKPRGKGGRTGQCLSCIREYNQRKYDEREAGVIRGRRYGRYNKWTVESYRQHVNLETRGEYTVIGDYAGFRKEIEHKHNKCGKPWMPTPSRFLEGKSCPYCVESKGERRVREYLGSCALDFEVQFTFQDCRGTRTLRYDFAVGSLDRLVLIEYDGEHHFRPVVYGGNEARALRDFERRKRNDRIKNDYCRANGIDLIRIRYDQFDEIETILDRRLSALGVTGSHPTEEVANITKEAS